MAPLLSNGHGDAGPERVAGVLTRTIIRSPVTRWILHARLRHKSLNDAVFVGSDFVHVRQVGEGGHLRNIATKDDFDAQIRAATVFRVDPDPLDEDFLVKLEDEPAPLVDTVPPDLLVLTLSTNDLVFVYLEARNDGSLHFVQQALPLPTFDRVLFQPGEHVAVDPYSRALAVAANEREVIICAAKPRDRIAREIRDGDENWCPVAALRALQVDGVIQHMDFLIPPDGDDDHIILLLIVVDRRRMKAIWVDWHDATDLHHAQVHPGQPLSSMRSVSSLLIPLRNAAFFIATGCEVQKYKGILTGPITGVSLAPLTDDTDNYGNSPMKPLWASWCRPHRHRASSLEKDHIYLVREDGLVLYINAMVDTATISNISAGHLRCHVGKAFASLGETTGPDILAVAGEMSPGRVVSIGHWPTANGARLDNMSWQDTMEMDLVQTIPNWASATDMLASSLPQSHKKLLPSRQSVYLTSGRQPYGSITEIRYGLEARSWACFDNSDFGIVTAMWTIPMASNGSLLLLMATPSSTRAFELDASGQDLKISEHHDTKALDLEHRTLAAGITIDGRMVQVTEDGVCETSSLEANFEDTAKYHCAAGDRIVAAALDAEHGLVVTAERRGEEYQVCYSQLPLPAGGTPTTATWSPTQTLPLPSTPLAVAVMPWAGKTLAAVATAEDGVILVTGNQSSARETCRIAPPDARDTPSVCDSLVLLRRDHTSDVLVLCGLRDGRLFAVVLSVDTEDSVRQRDEHLMHFGQSTVRLVEMSDRPSQACAMVGPDTYLLTWDGPRASSLTVQSIWYSDRLQPELAQGAVSACARVPASDFLAAPDFAGSLAIVSGDHFLITALDSTPDVVPRQISVNGTPNRLLYAEQQRCLVTASLQTGIRAFPTPSAQAEERRQIWPTIDFIPVRSSKPSFSHDMQPGERVYTLLEWSHRQDDKTYIFILVGGSYRKHNGTQGGRVTFLQPILAGREVVGVRPDPVIRSFEAPVYALAMYDALRYIVCYGRHVTLYRFSPQERKWEELCRPLALASPGVFVTVATPLIYVSTKEDSLATLQLKAGHDDDPPTLVLVGSSPQADTAISHVVVRPSSQAHSSDDESVALISTMDRSIVGLALRPASDTDSHRTIADNLLFRAELPRSLTRIRQATVRPPWKVSPPKGILLNDVIGVASDGTLVGISLLDEQLWRCLSWLQRLCEWSKLLSPHSSQTPLYSSVDQGYSRDERPLPIGISGNGTGSESEGLLRTSVDLLADKHIDGDVLARLLQRGGAETLREIIREVAARDDHVGTWTHEHIDEELAAVDEMVGLLGSLLEDSW
ncbi:hypothetical protein LTR53_002511 [Teratosphaeriaceae sp. CCFEE 6253]|nr:hypothetical protein LTR53_002511 [Teratosphaeriaceae sp. CCFEE 6253]